MVNNEIRELNPKGIQTLKQLIDTYQKPENINKIAELQNYFND